MCFIMSYLCIKYSGLRFYYIFETEDFIFIPARELNDKEKNRLWFEEIFSCQYDKDSNFYVFLKDPDEYNFTIDDFSEENLYKFKLLESILKLLFSNSLKRDYIFILEREDSEYTIKKIFNSLSKEMTEKKPPLLWKDDIIIKYLQELIDTGLDKLRSIDQKEDFALRYSFCVDMYLRGKFEENRLRFISDLWISLEVLSVITISHILYSHEKFEVDNFYEELKKIVEEYSSKISNDDIDCWEKMKDKFPDHMKNKINRFLPIFQKCVKVAEEYININDIKVKYKTEEEFNNFTEYQKYINAIKDFKDYQEKITIKNTFDKFYKYRNKLFHGGKISDKWSLKSDRYEANFIKILEQLLFRVLGLNMVYFYQMGYPYQRIFGIPKEEGKMMDLGKISQETRIYIHKNCIEPHITDFKVQFNDLEIAKKNYIDKKHKIEPLRRQLNSYVDKVHAFLEETHPVLFNEINYDHSINYQIINDRNIKLTFSPNSGIYGIIYDKKQVMIKNQDNTNISAAFIGMFDDADIRHGINIIVPFLINPPYISFEFN